MTDPFLLPDSFPSIENFVVLMLENRSFDHVLGHLKASDPRVDGILTGHANPSDPYQPSSPSVPIRPASSPVMLYDPPHEYLDVQVQLHAPESHFPPRDNYTPAAPPGMNGFVLSATETAGKAKGPGTPASPDSVMDYFTQEQVPVLSALAREFALFNYWHSSLPGPTWPNRFFVHAATSGGLTASPELPGILIGYEFAAGTIYKRLAAAGRSWTIYHTGLPQTAGIRSLRTHFLDTQLDLFRDMGDFASDVKAGNLADYTFIEPNYDTGSNYAQGNSMHPLNDIRDGEALVKQVYETLRASPYWENLMLVVVFDEHGAFYDHVPPPVAVPPGDGSAYATSGRRFQFDRLGVRVPAIVVTAYTPKGMVIGTDPHDTTTIYDHASIPATVAKRFNLPFMTDRDKAAHTLDVAVTLNKPRCKAADARMTLPDPAPDGAFQAPPAAEKPAPSAEAAEFSKNQESMLSLAHACHLEISTPAQQKAIIERHGKIRSPKDASDYIREVESKLAGRRKKNR